MLLSALSPHDYVRLPIFSELIHSAASLLPDLSLTLSEQGCVGGGMTVDWYLADLAVRAAGGLLLITFACLLLSFLKKCAIDAFGAVRGRAAGNSDSSVAPDEAGETKGAGPSAYQSHAVRAAQHVITSAGDRGNVRPEHVLFYDFVTAAARATIADASFAESVGRDMPR
jgi:hypothetical protein